MMISEESEDAFPKATLACPKKRGTIQHGVTEPCLTKVFHEIAEKDECYDHPKSAIGISREKTLEAIKICKVPPSLTPPKLISLPLSAKKYLQDKFNTPDNQMMVKYYWSEGLSPAIELKKRALRTGRWSPEWFVDFR